MSTRNISEATEINESHSSHKEKNKSSSKNQITQLAKNAIEITSTAQNSNLFGQQSSGGLSRTFSVPSFRVLDSGFENTQKGKSFFQRFHRDKSKVRTTLHPAISIDQVKDELQRKMQWLVNVEHHLKSGFDRDNPIKSIEYPLHLETSMRHFKNKSASELGNYFILNGKQIVFQEKPKAISGSKLVSDWLFDQNFPKIIYQSLTFNAFSYAVTTLFCFYPKLMTPGLVMPSGSPVSLGDPILFDVQWESQTGQFKVTQKHRYLIRNCHQGQNPKIIGSFEVRFSLFGTDLNGKINYSGNVEIEKFTVENHLTDEEWVILEQMIP